MATHLTSTLTDPLRRILLLGLPSGLVLTTPLALIACGGGDDAAAPVRNPLLDLPPGEVTSTLTRVLIDMPAGLSMPAAYVVGASGAVAVTANEAMVDVFADGPQLATVVAADGTPLLMGWIGSGRPAISAHSTATVLLHFGLGLPFFGPLTRDMLRERLQTQAAVATFGTQIAAILVADPKALATGSAALIDALGQAAQQLLPPSAAGASRAQPLGLKVEPATRLSGLQVVQGDTLNSCFVDNQYVRRAVVIVNREAWVDADGVRHAEPQAPVQVGEVMELPLPSAIDSVSNTVAGWANQFFAPDDPNGFFRSVSDTVTLEIAPEAAKRTEYSVVVLMAGKLPIGDLTAFDRLPASQQAYVRGLDITKNLMLKTLLIDLAGPFFFGMLSEKLGEFGKGKGASEARKELMTAFASALFGILQNQLPDLIQKLSDGTTDAWSAFKTVGKTLTFDPATGTMSPLLQEALTKLAEFCVARLADVNLRSSLLEVATGLKIGGRGVLGILPVLNIIGKFDTVLGYAALARIEGDVVRSRQMESWSVSATKAKVKLRPDPFEVETTHPTYPITAEIVDNDNDEFGVEKGSIDFDWECTGLYGSLYSRADTNLGKPNKFTTSKNFATPDYLPNGKEADGAPETISVTAYFQPIGAGGVRQLIGSATTTVKFKKAFSLRITPQNTELPTDEILSIVVSVVEPLPKTASVRYEWKLRSGAGELNISGADIDTAHSKVEYIAPADETVAVVEVVAVITVDPKLPPTRTDPVTSTLNVKKGLRQIVMEVSGGVFGCTDPKACGVSEYTAFIVPRLTKATSYTAVLSGYAYPSCNRSVTWNSVKGDGGGCNFPVTYHPHSSAGATNLWAVWIGFGGPFSGKCVVTITLSA